MDDKPIPKAGDEPVDGSWHAAESDRGYVIWSPKALESLRKGLGHLAMHWHMMAIEVCEHKKIEK